MKLRKRIRFSAHELELVARMICIADAGPWGEGDYQEWNQQDYAAFQSLRGKVDKLLDRGN